MGEAITNSADLGVNAPLIGRADGRARLSTPALIVDLPSLRENIAAMAAHCRALGLDLRPHTKTHKSVHLAKLQIEAGAVGVCCAKLGEAEAMVAGGVGRVLITSPVVAPFAVERLMRLNELADELIVVVDHIDNAHALDEAASVTGQSLRVLIDVDVGLHRTGIAPGTSLLALGKFVRDAKHLAFFGIQGYAGHIMHVHAFKERKTKSLEVMGLLKEARDALAAIGLDCPIVTGGGTGTIDIDPDAGVLTDIQGGSYLFMDKQYLDVEGKSAPLFRPSLFVDTTVISVNTPGIATTDGGFKSFSTDADPPVIHAGAPEGTSYMFFGDEQGLLLYPDKDHSLPLGARVTCLTPHCDPTVNLYDHYHVVEEGRLVDIWPIEARGRSQ